MSMPAGDALEQVVRHPAPHQVARPVRGQQRRRVRDDVVHDVGRLPDAEPADGVGLEPDLDRRLHALGAEIGKRPALHDAELRLARGWSRRRGPGSLAQLRATAPAPAAPTAPTAPSPACAVSAVAGVAMHSSSTIAMSEPSWAWMSVAQLGRQQVQRAVEMRAELRALLADASHRRQAEHLVAAAVGQDRSLPADEAMQPAGPRDQLVARPQEEVIGVAEDDLGAEILEVAMGDRLDRAARADRHEGRRLDDAVRRPQLAAARGAVAMRDAEVERAGRSCPHLLPDLTAVSLLYS